MNEIRKRRTADDFAVERDVDEMHSTLRWCKEDTKDRRTNLAHVVVHGRASRVRYRHFQVAVTRRVRVNYTSAPVYIHLY